MDKLVFVEVLTGFLEGSSLGRSSSWSFQSVPLCPHKKKRCCWLFSSSFLSSVRVAVFLQRQGRVAYATSPVGPASAAAANCTGPAVPGQQHITFCCLGTANSTSAPALSQAVGWLANVQRQAYEQGRGVHPMGITTQSFPS